ncbi:MAG TPA: sulfatase, partial [Candidatus Hydrogenedentes bacterium]|nr:sulfatase [Candidatus Hydrogenedentota bacterium]
MSSLDRRTFLSLLGAGALAAAWPRRAQAAQTRPNIVFMLADDLGRHQTACYGNPFYETPNVDRLASEGMRFMNAYAAAPVCSPTRASIMTGKYPARLHLTDFIPGSPFPNAKLKTPDWTKHLPVEETTIAEMLRDAGYACGHFGKWHLSVDKLYRPGRPGDPDTQGFEDVLALDKPESSEAAAAGADPDYDAHHTREITDRGIAFMRKNHDKPFFCYMAYSAVHRPEMEYAPRILKYAVKPEACNEVGNNPVLAAMMETLDTNVGRVLDTLDELGIADNTIVVFFSDNGDLYGRFGRKPLYGAKADLYEGGIRMPLIVRWPGVVRASSVSDAMVHSNDFFPTFAEIAGAPDPGAAVDGISFTPALKGAASLDRDTLYWHFPHYHSIGLGPSGAIRQGRYKLIEWFEHSVTAPDAPGALELYDLETDLGETRNLAAEMPELARELHGKLVAWRRAVNAQEMALNPDYIPARASGKG